MGALFRRVAGLVAKRSSDPGPITSPIMRTFSVLVLAAALFGSASAASPRPAVKRFAQGAVPKTLLHAAAPAPAPADSLASTATLLTKGGVVALVPYILLALASPAAREALVSVLTGMSAQGIVETFATYACQCRKQPPMWPGCQRGPSG
eukprot:scaffold27570_cov43-Phaeocystis_antarctica.AAC.3